MPHLSLLGLLGLGRGGVGTRRLRQRLHQLVLVRGALPYAGDKNLRLELRLLHVLLLRQLLLLLPERDRALFLDRQRFRLRRRRRLLDLRVSRGRARGVARRRRARARAPLPLGELLQRFDLRLRLALQRVELRVVVGVEDDRARGRVRGVGPAAVAGAGAARVHAEVGLVLARLAVLLLEDVEPSAAARLLLRDADSLHPSNVRLLPRDEPSPHSLEHHRRVVMRREQVEALERIRLVVLFAKLPLLKVRLLQALRLRSVDAVDPRRERLNRVHEVNASLEVLHVRAQELVLQRLLLLRERGNVGDAQRPLQLLHEVRKLRHRHVVRVAAVKLTPRGGERGEVFFAHGELFLLRVRLEVVQDHRDDEVEHDERAHQDEQQKEENRELRTGRASVDVIRVRRHRAQPRVARVVVRPGVGPGENLDAQIFDHAVVHDAVPRFPRGHSEQQEHRVGEVLEIRKVGDEFLPFDVPEQVHAHDGEDEEEQEQNAPDVYERREREDERLQQRAQALRAFDETQHARDAKHAQQGQIRRLHVRRHGDHEADDGDGDDDEVEAVPFFRDVCLEPHAHHLQANLQEEHDGEAKVCPKQSLRVLLRLVRVVHRHHDDVRRDQAHDDEVKLIVRHDAVRRIAEPVRRDVVKFLRLDPRHHLLDSLPLPLFLRHEKRRSGFDALLLVFILHLVELIDRHPDE
eukprot:31100-Pelagococcus_subviridis.AAC.3